MTINKDKTLNCNKCGHNWVSQKFLLKGELPQTCSKCKNYYWNEEDKNGKSRRSKKSD